MAYRIGQRVCLWQEVLEGDVVRVLQEVMVTIADIKTGVPGSVSGKPTSSQSLRGLGDDGKVYEKHWNHWPESQTSDFAEQWSFTDGGNWGVPFWVPKEAVYAHNNLRMANERFKGGNPIVRLDVNDQPILPKGDVVYCGRHDEYNHEGSRCIWCHMEKEKEKAE